MFTRKLNRIIFLAGMISFCFTIAGCATGPYVAQSNTTTGKPEITINASKEAIISALTSKMLQGNFMIKRQAENVIVFYNSTVEGSTWEDELRRGEYRVTFNLANTPNGILVMTSVVIIKNPNLPNESLFRDRSSGSQESQSLQGMLSLIKTELEGSNPADKITSIDIRVIGAVFNPDGKTVKEIEPNGPAAKSGLQAGDIIAAIDGTPISENALKNGSRLNGKPGTTVELLVKRIDKDYTVSVVRQVKPDAGWEPTPTTSNAATKPANNSSSKFYIISLGILTDNNIITSLIADGPAHKAGVKAGDIIVMIDDELVSSNFQETVTKLGANANPSVVLTLKRGNQILPIPVDKK